MEQVTLPEGEERRLLEALLTAKGTPRKAVTLAAAAKLLPASALFGNPAELEAALVRLASRGILDTTAKGKQRAWQVRAEVAQLLAPPRDRAAPAKRERARAVALEDLAALEARLTPRFDELAQRFDQMVQKFDQLNQKFDELAQRVSPSAPAHTHGPAPRDLPAHGSAPRDLPAHGSASAHAPAPNGKLIEAAIPTAIRQADQQGRRGGLVPIPDVRRLVVQQTGATRAQFDQALLAMERDFRVDLKIADDPRRDDAPEGIQVPGRGLVYYALAR